MSDDNEVGTPRRSVLYLPGANERALEKAKSLPADALILDLEDAVAPDAKQQARERVCAAVTSGEYGDRELAVRVNALDTDWHDADLRAVAQAGPAAIVVPKVNSARDVNNIERALELSGAGEHIAVWAMLETPTAVLRAEEIAASSDRLSTLVLGTNDLAKELHAEPGADRAPLFGGLSLCLLAARANGKAVLDGVYNNVSDADGFESECRQSRRFGFDGKTLIHPSQLEPCNRVFAPSEDEIEHARRVIEAFEQAKVHGQGVVTVDGQMVESLHVDGARRVLALADAVTGND